MFEGIFVEKVLTQKYIRPYPQAPQETSGYYVGSQGGQEVLNRRRAKGRHKLAITAKKRA